MNFQISAPELPYKVIINTSFNLNPSPISPRKPGEPFPWFPKGDDDEYDRRRSLIVERIVNIHIEKLPEGVYLATSGDIQGLVAQGRTIWETLEIARDVARKLLEAQGDGEKSAGLTSVAERFDYPLVLEI